MKKGALATQHSGGKFADLIIENSKHQTIGSDFEDAASTSVYEKSSGKKVHSNSIM